MAGTKIFTLTGCHGSHGGGDGGIGGGGDRDADHHTNVYRIPLAPEPYVMTDSQEMVIASSDWHILGDIYMYGNVSLLCEENPEAENRQVLRTLSSKLDEPLDWVDFGGEYHLVIPHRLGRYPLVRVLDTDNREMEVEVVHINSYFTRLKSNLDVSGTLYVI